jgi:GNAT superfamily N-acetyltransferase
VRIETATVQALDAAVRLLRAQFTEHAIELGDGALIAAIHGLLDDSSRGTVLLAYDPEPVGIAVLAYTWTLEHGGPVAWLDELFVVPDRRGRGIGLAMLRQAVDTAKKGGCRAVDVEVDAQHERAEHLYEREGFERLLRKRWTKRLLPLEPSRAPNEHE